LQHYQQLAKDDWERYRKDKEAYEMKLVHALQASRESAAYSSISNKENGGCHEQSTSVAATHAMKRSNSISNKSPTVASESKSCCTVQANDVQAKDSADHADVDVSADGSVGAVAESSGIADVRTVHARSLDKLGQFDTSINTGKQQLSYHQPATEQRKRKRSSTAEETSQSTDSSEKTDTQSILSWYNMMQHRKESSECRLEEKDIRSNINFDSNSKRYSSSNDDNNNDTPPAAAVPATTPTADVDSTVATEAYATKPPARVVSHSVHDALSCNTGSGTTEDAPPVCSHTEAHSACSTHSSTMSPPPPPPLSVQQQSLQLHEQLQEQQLYWYLLHQQQQQQQYRQHQQAMDLAAISAASARASTEQAGTATQHDLYHHLHQLHHSHLQLSPTIHTLANLNRLHRAHVPSAIIDATSNAMHEPVSTLDPVSLLLLQGHQQQQLQQQQQQQEGVSWQNRLLLELELERIRRSRML
jgi:hypothetical protein